MSDGCSYPVQETKFLKFKNCPIDWMIFGRLRSQGFHHDGIKQVNIIDWLLDE